MTRSRGAGWSSRPPRIVAALPLLVAVLATAVAIDRGSNDAPHTPAPAGHAARRVPSPRPAVTQAGSAAAQLRRAVIGDGGHAAVAGLDLRSGAIVAVDANRRFYTASIEKVDIAVVLFRELAAAGRPLSSSQRDLLSDMIEHSDNSAASTLWADVGGSDGIDDSNHALGLTHTVAGAHGEWGLTRTTAADQLTLLRRIVVGHAITGRDRDLLMDFMDAVETDQRWGVSAAADGHETTAVKDGWLPHRADEYRWVINSMGLVGDRRTGVIMAVLSDHHASKSTGIWLVDRVARLTGHQLRRG